MALPAVLLAPVAQTAHPAPPADEPIHRHAARYAWAALLARIYAVFPLRCPTCGGAMRIIAFVTDAAVLRDILRALKRADGATHQRPGPPTPTVGGNGRCRQRRGPRGYSRPTRSGLRLRSAHRLVGGPPRAPPWRGVGATRAGRRQRPEVRPAAMRCRRNRPGKLPQHNMDGGSSALAHRSTGIAKPGILGLLG